MKNGWSDRVREYVPSSILLQIHSDIPLKDKISCSYLNLEFN